MEYEVTTGIKFKEVDGPPPGDGLFTSINFIPAVEISAAVILA